MKHTTNSQHSQATAAVHLETIGQQLQKARLTQQISLEYVANSLRLPMDVLINFERDSFENMGALTYVRGYLRNFAQLVNLDADVLIKNFNELNLKEGYDHRVRLDLRKLRSRTKSNSHFGNKWFWSLATLVFVLVVIFYAYMKRDPSMSTVDAYMENSTQQLIEKTVEKSAAVIATKNLPFPLTSSESKIVALSASATDADANSSTSEASVSVSQQSQQQTIAKQSLKSAPSIASAPINNSNLNSRRV